MAHVGSMMIGAAVVTMTTGNHGGAFLLSIGGMVLHLVALWYRSQP
jgi:hypothetical protein